VFGDNGKDDTILYLEIEEGGLTPYAVTGLGTTGYSGTITYGTASDVPTATDNSDRANILDTTNIAELDGAGSIQDKVGPVLMKAELDSVNVNLYFSEAVSDTGEVTKCVEFTILDTNGYGFTLTPATDSGPASWDEDLDEPATATATMNRRNIGELLWVNSGLLKLTMVDGYTWPVDEALGIQLAGLYNDITGVDDIAWLDAATDPYDDDAAATNPAVFYSGDPDANATWYTVGNKGCPFPYIPVPEYDNVGLLLIEGIPSIMLTAPGSGTIITDADTLDVKWTSTVIDSVDVYLSINNGASYTLIAGSRTAAADGMYTWLTPCLGDNLKFKVMSSDSLVSSASSTVQVISYSGTGEPVVGPAITVLFPNGGEIIDAVEGYAVPIIWSSAEIDADATAILSYQANGGTWTTIVDAEADSAVTAAAAVLDSANVDKAAAVAALADADSVVTALTDSLAAAAAADTAAVRALLDAAVLDQTAAAEADSVAQVVVDDATTAHTAAVGDAEILVSDGSYSWVPGAALAGMNVKVKVTSNTVNDMSDNTFKIQGSVVVEEPDPDASIAVMYPSGGEVIDVVGVDGTITISWESSGLAEDDAAILSYSVNGGAWTTMVDADAVEAVTAAVAIVDSINIVLADTTAAAAPDSVIAAITATLTAAEADLVTAQADSVILVSDGEYVWKGIVDPDRPEYNLFWTGSNIRVKVTSGDVSDISGSCIINPIEDDISPITSMSVSDVPDDNGNLVLIKFKPAARSKTVDGVTTYSRGWNTTGTAENHVKSFQIYLKANLKSPYAYIGSVPSDIMLSAGKYILMAYSPANEGVTWGIIASTKESASVMVSAGKLGNVPLAVVDPTVAKIADEVFISEMVSAIGFSIDNIAPSPFTGFNANSIDDGVRISWTVPEDHGLVGMISGDVLMLGQAAIPVYGVNSYEIYRKAITEDEYGDPIGTVGNGVLEFIDTTGVMGIEYSYQVKAVDGNPEHYVVTDIITSVLEAKPEVYALSNNFPNPFNPTTSIEYQIPTNGNVELVIFNMAGQKVRTLVSESKDAGFYKVVWNGKDDMGETVSSGMYFFKLVSGNFSKIEKMTLIK